MMKSNPEQNSSMRPFYGMVSSGSFAWRCLFCNTSLKKLVFVFFPTTGNTAFKLYGHGIQGKKSGLRDIDKEEPRYAVKSKGHEVTYWAQLVTSCP